MNYLSIEIVSTIIFLIGLVVVYNLRTIIENESKISFRYIAIGLSLLASCSTFSVLVMQQVFTTIPLLGSAIFSQILYWIGMITGLTFLLSGVSNWLPVYRKHIKVNSQALSKLEIFKKIEQLIRFENRNKVILLQTLELMRTQYNFSEVGCFLFSQQKKKMRFLAVSNDENNVNVKTHSIYFNNSAIANSIENNNIELNYLSETQESAPDLLIPMTVKGKLLGVFCFYTKQNIDKQGIDNLKLITDIITEKIYQDSLNLQNDAVNRQLSWIHKLEQSIDNTKTVKENINTIKRLLKEEIEVDFMTISYEHDNKSRKITISENNQVLESVRDSYESQNELERYVLDNKLSVAIQDVEKETDFIIDLHALQSDMKSIVAYPISNQNIQVGVIVVGSKNYNAYSKPHDSCLDILTHKLEKLIANSIRQIEEKKEIFQRETLKIFFRKASSGVTSIELYQQISDFVVKEMNASFVRISLFDQDRRFLNSQVLSLSNDSISATPEDAAMMLTLMPNHRNVTHARKTVLVEKTIDQSDETLMEQRQIFGSKLSKYIISPFYSGGSISGVVTVGYTQHSVEVSKKNIAMLEDITTVISVHNNFKRQNSRILNMKKNTQDKQILQDRIKWQNLSRNKTTSFQDEFVGV